MKLRTTNNLISTSLIFVFLLFFSGCYTQLAKPDSNRAEQDTYAEKPEEYGEEPDPAAPQREDQERLSAGRPDRGQGVDPRSRPSRRTGGCGGRLGRGAAQDAGPASAADKVQDFAIGILLRLLHFTELCVDDARRLVGRIE